MCGAMQVLDALPDDEFSVCLTQPHQLVPSTAMAVKLPARLKVKWLRADCLSVLDLRAPEVNVTLQAWRSLVMCMTAVPSLKELAVRLPQDDPPKPWVNITQPRSQYLRGCLCSRCDSAAYRQLQQAAQNGEAHAQFAQPVNIPDGVHATWRNLQCDSCRCALVCVNKCVSNSFVLCAAAASSRD